VIINNTHDGASIFYSHVFWDDFFSLEELNMIVGYCENKKLENGTIMEEAKNHEIRKSKINFTEPDEENRWIFNKLNHLTDMVNEKFYKFDLVGYNNFQFTTYKSSEKGHYDWHIDSLMGQPNENKNGLHRKLSMTLLLNDDFEGGDFEINLSQPEKIDVRKGRAIFFPSHILHRVTPITKGTRKSLVIWVEGARWK
jgi:PKHD-type hydroxylase